MDSEYRQLIDEFMHGLPDVLACLQLTREQLPWLWSADFIRRTDGGSYAISEFNASCVGLSPFYPAMAGASIEAIPIEERERGQARGRMSSDAA